MPAVRAPFWCSGPSHSLHSRDFLCLRSGRLLISSRVARFLTVALPSIVAQWYILCPSFILTSVVFLALGFPASALSGPWSLQAVKEEVKCSEIPANNSLISVQTSGCEIRLRHSTQDGVICSRGRVIAINLAQSGISGSLSPVHGNLTSLTSLQLEFNNIYDPLPRLSKLYSLQKIYLQSNAFDSIPSGFFIGLSSLQGISLDDLPLTPWSLSQDITSATGLVYFSAINACLTRLIPDFLGSLLSLDIIHLSYNQLTSPLPSSFADLSSRNSSLITSNLVTRSPAELT
ncbi:hypothetical protein ZIOFF_050076 [Zingiber officinale]|uniref:Uncharacterized protein n=1 Tax=Zingiber officinale TaxID=94328 RepID=A0A8J5FQJ8_ZINOF|nr:hypothetical protein ZIOFF_050076 [Zingiber officinale]